MLSMCCCRDISLDIHLPRPPRLPCRAPGLEEVPEASEPLYQDLRGTPTEGFTPSPTPPPSDLLGSALNPNGTNAGHASSSDLTLGGSAWVSNAGDEGEEQQGGVSLGKFGRGDTPEPESKLCGSDALTPQLDQRAFGSEAPTPEPETKGCGSESSGLGGAVASQSSLQLGCVSGREVREVTPVGGVGGEEEGTPPFITPEPEDEVVGVKQAGTAAAGGAAGSLGHFGPGMSEKDQIATGSRQPSSEQQQQQREAPDGVEMKAEEGFSSGPGSLSLAHERWGGKEKVEGTAGEGDTAGVKSESGAGRGDTGGSLGAFVKQLLPWPLGFKSKGSSGGVEEGSAGRAAAAGAGVDDKHHHQQQQQQQGEGGSQGGVIGVERVAAKKGKITLRVKGGPLGLKRSASTEVGATAAAGVVDMQGDSWMTEAEGVVGDQGVHDGVLGSQRSFTGTQGGTSPHHHQQQQQQQAQQGKGPLDKKVFAAPTAAGGGGGGMPVRPASAAAVLAGGAGKPPVGAGGKAGVRVRPASAPKAPRVQRCGECHYCKNRHLKKGCIRNREMKEAQAAVAVVEVPEKGGAGAEQGTGDGGEGGGGGTWHGRGEVGGTGDSVHEGELRSSGDGSKSIAEPELAAAAAAGGAAGVWGDGGRGSRPCSGSGGGGGKSARGSNGRFAPKQQQHQHMVHPVGVGGGGPADGEGGAPAFTQAGVLPDGSEAGFLGGNAATAAAAGGGGGTSSEGGMGSGSMLAAFIAGEGPAAAGGGGGGGSGVSGLVTAGAAAAAGGGGGGGGGGGKALKKNAVPGAASGAAKGQGGGVKKSGSLAKVRVGRFRCYEA